jgi:hypothetical protein
VDTPDNLGTTQAVIRKISTFEIIDGDITKEHIWGFDLEEEIDFYLRAAGVDSEYFFNTLGLPLYIVVTSLIMVLILLLINLCRRIGCSNKDADNKKNSEEEAPADFEGGEQDSTV